MANDCIPYNEDADRLPAQATATIAGKRFVKISAGRDSGPLIPATAQVGASDPVDGGRIQVAQCAASSDRAIGVSSWDAANDEGLTVIREGVVPVTSGAAITAGAPVMTDANGKAIAWVFATSNANPVLGYCVDTVAGADVDAQILLAL